MPPRVVAANLAAILPAGGVSIVYFSPLFVYLFACFVYLLSTFILSLHIDNKIYNNKGIQVDSILYAHTRARAAAHEKREQPQQSHPRYILPFAICDYRTAASSRCRA